MKPETQELVKKMCERDDCRTQNEFIEKAIRFYSGYVSAEEAEKFLPFSLVNALQNTVANSENHIARLLFKLSVELDMLLNVMASELDIEEDELEKLRGRCVPHVKETSGAITFKDAVAYQKGQ